MTKYVGELLKLKPGGVYKDFFCDIHPTSDRTHLILDLNGHIIVAEGIDEALGLIRGHMLTFEWNDRPRSAVEDVFDA